MVAFTLILVVVLTILACVRGWGPFGMIPPVAAMLLFIMLESGGHVVPAGVWAINIVLWPPMIFMVVTGERGKEMTKNFFGNVFVTVRDFDAFDAWKKLKRKLWTDSDWTENDWTEGEE